MLTRTTSRLDAPAGSPCSVRAQPPYRYFLPWVTHIILINVSSDDLNLGYGQATWKSYVEDALDDVSSRHVAIARKTGVSATPTAETLFGRGRYPSAAERYWAQASNLPCPCQRYAS